MSEHASGELAGQIGDAPLLYCTVLICRELLLYCRRELSIPVLYVEQTFSVAPVYNCLDQVQDSLYSKPRIGMRPPSTVRYVPEIMLPHFFRDLPLLYCPAAGTGL